MVPPKERPIILNLIRRRAHRLLRQLVPNADVKGAMEWLLINELSGMLPLALCLNTPRGVEAAEQQLRLHGYRLVYDAALKMEAEAEMAAAERMVEEEIARCPKVEEHPFIAKEEECSTCSFIQMEEPEIDTRNRPNPP